MYEFWFDLKEKSYDRNYVSWKSTVFVKSKCVSFLLPSFLHLIEMSECSEHLEKKMSVESEDSLITTPSR